jgi:exonuclease III
VLKRNKISELIRIHNIDFIAIQETKMEVITPNFCFNLWGSEDCDWVFLPSERNSGGVLSMWNKVISRLNFTFVGEDFVGVCLDWGIHHRKCFVINVYAKGSVEDKKRLWESLVAVRRSLGEGAWCTLGDFNAVSNRDERREVNDETSSSQVLEINFFNDFVREVELDDLNVLGRRYTWYHPNGIAMSKIDRILTSEEWTHYWGATSL